MSSNTGSLLGRISRRAKVLLATSVAGSMLASSCNLNDARALLAGVEEVASQLERGSGSNFGDQLLDELDRIF